MAAIQSVYGIQRMECIITPIAILKAGLITFVLAVGVILPTAIIMNWKCLKEIRRVGKKEFNKLKKEDSIVCSQRHNS